MKACHRGPGSAVAAGTAGSRGTAGYAAGCPGGPAVDSPGSCVCRFVRGTGAGRAVCGLGAVDEGAGPAGGDGAVAGDPGRFGVGLEEGAVGHDELDLDPGDPARGAGAAFDEGVGHGLAAGAGVPGGAEGVGVPGQGGVYADAGGDREQGGEVAHGVRGRAEADMPLGGGVRGAVGDGAGVQPVRGGPGGGHQPPVTGPGEGAGVGGEVRVDGGPVRGGQARGFAHEQGGAPFVQLPGLQRGEGVRHFGHEGFGQAQEPAALGGGFVPGEGDLRADPGAELLRGDPGGGLGAALGRHRRRRRCRACRAAWRISGLRVPGSGR